MYPCSFGFDPLGLLDPTNSGGFVNPQWLAYSEVGVEITCTCKGLGLLLWIGRGRGTAA